MSRKLIIPKESIEGISRFISLSEEHLQTLFDILDLKYTEDDEGIVILSEIAERLNLSTQLAVDLVKVLANLSYQKENFKLDDETFINELKEVFIDPERADQVSEIEKIVKKKGLILKVINPRPNADQFEKIKFLKTGLIKTANNFRSFCDIRPVFNKEKNQIDGLIPTIIIMKVEFEEEEEEVVFQLNQDSFEKLKKFIEETSGKLQLVENLVDKTSKYLGVKKI